VIKGCFLFLISSILWHHLALKTIPAMIKRSPANILKIGNMAQLKDCCHFSMLFFNAMFDVDILFGHALPDEDQRNFETETLKLFEDQCGIFWL
jgi:hypothetical protein